MRYAISVCSLFICVQQLIASQIPLYIGDHINCEAKLWGDLSGEIPLIPPGGNTELDKVKRSGPKLITSVSAGAVRLPYFHDKYPMSQGELTLNTQLPENVNLILNTGYRHAVKLDSNGQITEARQWACLGGTILKEGWVVGDTTSCEISVPEDPFASDGNGNEQWQKVEVANGIPLLDYHLDLFIESLSGGAVYKVSCSGYSQGNPIEPIPLP